jgi:16S rRNA G966 N2-methylase RsmD
MKVFDRYPKFITSDPRLDRVGAYHISNDFMTLRHTSFFNSEILENKTVLDLGCCVGASGAWVLANSAKFYCGVEYHKDLANIAIDNLSVFDKNTWQVVNTSVESFLEESTEKYDIVIASGIIYAFFEPIPILKNIAMRSNTVIIESVHPKIPGIDIETASVIAYKRQHMLYGTTKTELCFNSAIPSMTFVIDYMKHHGFECDLSVNNDLKKYLPDVYQTDRFGIKLVKNRNSEISHGFLSATTFPKDVKIKNWSIK